MREQDLITQAQAATILGRSVSAVSRAVKAGRLEYVDPKRRLFSRPGLEVRYANHTRRRVDQPMVKTQKAAKDRCEVLTPRNGRSASIQQPEPERTIPETYWERVADKLDCVLQGCSNYWPEYDAERLRVFARALDEVRDQCRAEGLNDLAPLAKEHRGIF